MYLSTGWSRCELRLNCQRKVLPFFHASAVHIAIRYRDWSNTTGWAECLNTGPDIAQGQSFGTTDATTMLSAWFGRAKWPPDSGPTHTSFER